MKGSPCGKVHKAFQVVMLESKALEVEIERKCLEFFFCSKESSSEISGTFTHIVALHFSVFCFCSVQNTSQYYSCDMAIQLGKQ